MVLDGIVAIAAVHAVHAAQEGPAPIRRPVAKAPVALDDDDDVSPLSMSDDEDVSGASPGLFLDPSPENLPTLSLPCTPITADPSVCCNAFLFLFHSVQF
jgi:hypothetical protein